MLFKMFEIIDFFLDTVYGTTWLATNCNLANHVSSSYKYSGIGLEQLYIWNYPCPQLLEDLGLSMNQ